MKRRAYGGDERGDMDVDEMRRVAKNPNRASLLIIIRIESVNQMAVIREKEGKEGLTQPNKRQTML